MIVALTAGRDVPGELRDRLALDEDAVRRLLRGRRADGEVAILSTCHRTEVYISSAGTESDDAHRIATLLPALRPDDRSDVRILRGREAVEHLFRVACGLESLVVGERQIIGQVRRALVLAQEEGTSGKLVTTLFSRAIRVGKRVREVTGLGSEGFSIGGLAADHLDRLFGGLEGRSGAVVGSGDAAADAAQALVRAGVKVTVVGRSRSPVENLARAVDGTPQPLSALREVLRESEFVVVAVGGGMLLRAGDLAERGLQGPYVVIDLSRPRAVQIPAPAGVVVVSLDGLHPRADSSTAPAIAQAEKMIAAELDGAAGLAGMPDGSAGAIGTLRRRAARMVQLEVARTLATLSIDFDERDAERIAALATRVANKLLHGPSVALRDADPAMRALLIQALELEE